MQAQTTRAELKLELAARERAEADAAGAEVPLEPPAQSRASLFFRAAKLWRARSRLYRSQILQVNTRWKALAEIYTMHSFAPVSNLKIFVKNC